MNCRITAPIRVLYVTHESNLTGASRSLVDLLTALDPAAVSPLVLLRRKGPLCEKLDGIGVQYVIVPYARSVKSESSSMRDVLKRPLDSFASLAIAALIKDRKIDLVHCNSLLQSVGAKASRLAGVPYVFHVRDLVQEDHGLSFLDEGEIKQLLDGSSMNIFISEYVKSKFASWAPDASSIALHDGIFVERYCCQGSKAPIAEPLRLLLPGRITPGKGQLEAIKAVEILRNEGVGVFLRIVGGVGDALYASEVSDYIGLHDLASVVEVKAFVDEISDEYRCADIALVCSTSEAMGRVAIESMLAGCLCIAADAGALPEIVEDGITGLTYESGNPRDLAQKIKFALSSPGHACQIAHRGTEWAKTAFDSAAYARKIQALYTDILGDITTRD